MKLADMSTSLCFTRRISDAYFASHLHADSLSFQSYVMRCRITRDGANEQKRERERAVSCEHSLIYSLKLAYSHTMFLAT